MDAVRYTKTQINYIFPLVM